jgi:cyclophilin family peptidyl-prolyl cis-trans isomerase
MTNLRIPSPRPFFTALACLAALAWVPSARADTTGNATATPAGNTSAAPAPAPAPAKNPIVVMDTSLGPVEMEIFVDKAPITAANFLQYVDAGFYNGTTFHRVIPTFMIQGGGFTPDMTEKPTRPPIKNEAGNGLSNDLGTLAMARTSVVDSATAQFFINVTDNPFLNHTDNSDQGYGYAVFGKVVSGMDVVNKIKIVPTGVAPNGMGDVPLTPVIIKSIKRK